MNLLISLPPTNRRQKNKGVFKIVGVNISQVSCPNSDISISNRGVTSTIFEDAAVGLTVVGFAEGIIALCLLLQLVLRFESLSFPKRVLNEQLAFLGGVLFRKLAH
jgi:hypothetical protein